MMRYATCWADIWHADDPDYKPLPVKCEDCGQITDDWAVFDDKKGLGVCTSCLAIRYDRVRDQHPTDSALSILLKKTRPL